jgi:hypothetical protein
VTRPFAAFVSLPLLAFLAFEFPACVDTSPVDYTAPALVSLDAGPVGVDPALVAACKACTATGACSAQFAGCLADPRSAAMAHCIVDSYCLSWPPADIGHLPPCIFACANKGGISSQSDPAIVPVVPLIICAQDRTATGCGDVCDPATQDK